MSLHYTPWKSKLTVPFELFIDEQKSIMKTKLKRNMFFTKLLETHNTDKRNKYSNQINLPNIETRRDGTRIS